MFFFDGFGTDTKKNLQTVRIKWSKDGFMPKISQPHGTRGKQTAAQSEIGIETEWACFIEWKYCISVVQVRSKERVSLDFRACGWRDLVHHETANWFSSLYVQNSAHSRWKFPSLGTLIECNFAFTQRAHLPPVFYFLGLACGNLRYIQCAMLKKKKTIFTRNSVVDRCKWSLVKRLWVFLDLLCVQVILNYF